MMLELDAYVTNARMVFLFFLTPCVNDMVVHGTDLTVADIGY
jgi:hypothetical protein